MTSPPMPSSAASTLSIAGPIRASSLSVFRMTDTAIARSASVEIIHEPAPVLAGETADIDITACDSLVHVRRSRQRQREGLVAEDQPGLKREALHQGRLRATTGFHMAGTVEIAKHRVQYRHLLTGK